MKIRALRVREVAAFREPVALEGLGGALDVLAGPNEFGKSTLLRALDAVFLAEHKTTRADLKRQLTPDAGGAPVIEVDFELGVDRYRLRKRFFSAPKASLARADGSAVWRGADAEAQLAELLASAGGPQRLGLLWVRQSQSLDEFEIDGGTSAGLKGLIERELLTATGGAKARMVRALIRKKLDELATPSTRRPRGPFKEAFERHERLTRELERLTRKQAEGKAATERLVLLRESERTLSDPVARAERTQRIAASRAALEAARSAFDRRRAAEEGWKRLAQESGAAAAELAAFERQMRDEQALAAEVKRLQLAVAEAVAARDQAHAARSTLAGDLAQHADTERTLAAGLEEAHRHQAAKTALTALRRRLVEITDLTHRVRELRVAAAANRATPEVLRAAEASARAIEGLTAKLATASVRVTITYETGGEGKIVHYGEPVVAGREHLFEEAVELAIAGVGRISIAPGDAVTPTKARAELALRQQELASALARAGVGELGGLRALAVERSETAAQLDRVASRLDGLCPEGPQSLKEEIDRLSVDAPSGVADPAPIELELAGARRRCEAAKNAHAAAIAKAQDAEVTAARFEAESAATTQRHANLRAGLPGAEAVPARREALQETADRTRAQASEAAAILSALREREPDARQMVALEAELAAAVAVDEAARSKANTEARETAALESLLQRDALDGIAERLGECEGDLAAASQRKDDLAREVAALGLLDAEFDRAEADTRSRYLQPVTERLQLYLGHMLPGADLELGDSFGARTIARGGRVEPLAQLSEGTREQVAVLVRLGLARLLAEWGEPLPLILDDALVYADDQRLAGAFAALRDASCVHQVIVFTCRAKAFEAIGGNRLMLRPWDGFVD